MNIIRRASSFITSRIDALFAGFDLRDVFLFGGLSLLTYGLYLYRPWVGFAICGLLLMLISQVMRGPK